MIKSPEERIAELRSQVADLTSQLNTLQDATEGNLPAAYSRMQYKIARQASALDSLNRKVASQRFYLRVMNELGHGVSKEEYLAAKEALENTDKAERLDYELVEA